MAEDHLIPGIPVLQVGAGGKMRRSLIVASSGSLVALSRGGDLDRLLLPDLRVVIPDMVRFTLARHPDKSVVRDVLDWIRRNEPERVHVGTTETFDEFVFLFSSLPGRRLRSRGTRAVAEILSRELSASDHGPVILLVEDAEGTKTNVLVSLPDRVVVHSTASFLMAMETVDERASVY